MINHIEIRFSKINDHKKLTTRGFFHLFTQDAHQGLLFVEVWGYKPGNGYSRYMNICADDWSDYVQRRLDSKGLNQVDGKNIKVVATVERFEVSKLEPFVNELLTEKRSSEITLHINQLRMSPCYTYVNEEVSLYNAAYNMLHLRDRGGVHWEGNPATPTIALCDEPAIVIKGSDKVFEPVYTEWGTY